MYFNKNIINILKNVELLKMSFEPYQDERYGNLYISDNRLMQNHYQLLTY